MNSSLNRGRRWTVVQARIEEGTLRNLQSSSESESDSGDDEGFGVEHHLDTFKATSSIARSASQHGELFIAGPSGVGSSRSKGEVGDVSPERVQQECSTPTDHARASHRISDIVLTPSDAGTSPTSEVSIGSAFPSSPSSSTRRRPEEAPEALPGMCSFPPISLSVGMFDSDLPSTPDTPEGKQERADHAPLHGSKIRYSPSLNVKEGDQDKQSSPTIPSPSPSATSSPTTARHGAGLGSATSMTIGTNPWSGRERSSQEERDMRSLIALVSLMAGLAVPARLSWLVLLACYSAAVAIVTRLAPALRSAASEGGLMSFVTLVEERQEPSACSNGPIAAPGEVSKVPLLHGPVVEADNNKAAPVRSVVPLLRAESLSNFSVSGSPHRSLALVGMGKTLAESPKHMTGGRCSDVDALMEGQDRAGVSAGKEHEALLDANGDREGDQGSDLSEDDLHHEILASLSEDHRAFVASAGEKEQDQLVQQCLAYANGEIQQARKVCSKFCKFRVGNGWRMLLSPTELEVPLRSRTHTLARGHDDVGRAILTFSPGKMDMTKCPAASYQKMLCYVLQEVLKEKELQTKGIVLLVDARDVGFNTLKHFKMADYRRGLGMLGGAFPAKLKAIRILHPTRALRVALAIGMPLMSSKMQARLQVVSDQASVDGSFTKDLADPAVVPVELGIGGTWEDSVAFWDSWVDGRVRPAI